MQCSAVQKKTLIYRFTWPRGVLRGEDGGAGYPPATDCLRLGTSTETATMFGGGTLVESSGASIIAAGIFPDNTCV